MVIPPNRLPRISRTIGADVPMTPTLQQRIAGDITGKKRIPSPFKWAGSKASPHYLGPLRDAAQMTGAKRLLEPTLGGANIALNMPMREVKANDADAYLVNAFKQMRDAPGGLELDWKPWKGHGMTEGNWKGDEMPDPDRISKPTFLGPRASRGKYADYEGPVMRGITSGEDPGSFNAMIAQFQADPRSVNPRDMAEMFMMNQQLSMNAWSRLNRKGQYNQSPGSLRIGEDKWNYQEYAPLMEHWTMSQLPLDDFLEHVEADPLRDMAVLDPPYGGGEVGGYDYLDMMGGDAHKNLAEQLGGLAEDGLPIVAFNAATEADHYRDQGFRTLLNRRPDSTSSKASSRGIKPEMIAIANVPHMTADRWFQNNPTQRFGTQQGDVETWNQDPRFDEDFDPDLWKAHFFPNGDPQLSARRSIVNDLDELADTLMKALGEEGELFHWDRQLYPDTARKFSTNAGDYDRIFNYIRDDVGQDKIDDFYANNRVDYPLEGRKIAPWKDVMDSDSASAGRNEAWKTIGGQFGSPSKMPGPTWSLPTHLCMRGGQLRKVPGSTCHRCYAHGQGNYGMNPTQTSLWRNAHQLLTPDEEGTGKFASAMANRLPVGVFDYGEPNFRWFDSGDLQGPEHLSMISDIARDANKKMPIDMWLPTREHKAVYDFLNAPGRDWDTALPENLAVKLSAPYTGQTMDDDQNKEMGFPSLASKFREVLEHPQVGFSSTSASGDNMHICPASIGKKGDRCDDYGCRKCWDPSSNISYNMHTGGRKNVRTPLLGGRRVDYTKDGIPLIDRVRSMQDGF